jgi:predicted acylesterase/phospholipase RssA
MRALVLAGGGMKVAYQAGVLQVLLDEAQLDFDIVDAASGGVFNAAMLCQGMSGTDVANKWREFRPLRGAQVNWRHPLQSVFVLDRFRRNVLRDDWHLDWDAITHSTRRTNFNVFDVALQQNRVVPAVAMNEDLLVAGVSLPVWFPPVRIGGRPYIDAVFVTDANLDEVVAAGATEIWVIWTVSRTGRWRDGFLNQYFQVIEAAANGRYAEEAARALAAGVTINELRAEVPLNYLLNFSSTRFHEAVELGVRDTRRWLTDRGYTLTPPPPPPPTPRAERVSLTFREPFGGQLAFTGGTPLDVRVKLQITVEDMDVFLASPDHEMVATGELRADALGGRRPIAGGGVRLNVEVPGSPWEKRMRYRLPFADGAGHALTLLGEKVVRNDPGFDLWDDTTRFHTRVARDHVAWADFDDPTLDVVASGDLVITLREFTLSMLTYRAQGPTRVKALEGRIAFMRQFLGKLWDVYASKLSTYSPF